jgi:hypothetical protein
MFGAAATTSEGGFVAITGGGSDWRETYPLRIVKVNWRGEVIWDKNYLPLGYNTCYGNSIIETPDGGYIAVSELDGGSSGGIWLTRFDTNGDTLWTRIFGDALPHAVPYSIVITTEGYIIAGHSSGLATEGAYFIMTDRLGNVLWERIYGGPYPYIFESAYSIAPVSRNGWIAACTGDGGVWIIRLDEDGDTLWTKRYLDLGEDLICRSMVRTDYGFYYLGCQSHSSSTRKLCVIKIDSLAYVQWVREFGRDSEPWGLTPRVALSLDGGCFYANNVYHYPSAAIAVYKLTAEGDTVWRQFYDAPSSYSMTCLTSTPDGGFLIGGFNYGPFPYLMRADSLGFTGISETQTLKPENISISFFPNPFNSAVSISTPIESKVEIFNVTGKSIAELPGGTQIWRPDNSVGSGIYLVRAKMGDKEVTKRVVYLK